MAGSYPHPQAPVQPYSELEYDNLGKVIIHPSRWWKIMSAQVLTSAQVATTFCSGIDLPPKCV